MIWILLAAGLASIALAASLAWLQSRERRADSMALRNFEARVTGILESAMDAIITVDQDQTVVMFNKAAEQVFGCSAAQAVGAPLSSFIPERFRAGHGEHIRRFGETGAT